MVRGSEGRNGGFDDRDGYCVFPGEMRALARHHHCDLSGRGALPGAGSLRCLGTPAAGSPLGDNTQAAAEAGEAEATPELGAIAAAARPDLVELYEPRLKRPHADTEDIVALTA